MSEDVEVAILFADVVDSTNLYEILEDAAARELLARCLEEMEAATEHCGGTVIKTMGDEVMATFETADYAVMAGAEMHKRMGASEDLAVSGTPLSLRVGCHIGRVAVDKQDIFGSAVHTAKRMVTAAKPHQIVTTSDLVDRLSIEWSSAARPIDLTVVKGQSHELAVYEILWQLDEATTTRPTLDWIERRSVPSGRLLLRWEDGDLEVSDSLVRVTFGRAPDSDVVIDGDLVSRLHARIELSRARFYLVDESTNGTLVCQSGRGELWVRRDSIELHGEGVIWLGGTEQQDSRCSVRYAIES